MLSTATNGWCEAIHEAQPSFKFLTEPKISSPPPAWNPRSEFLLTLLGADTAEAKHRLTHYISGNVSLPGTVIDGMRIVSTPIVYDNRSVSLTRIHIVQDNDVRCSEQIPGLCTTLLDLSDHAVGIVDAANPAIIAFNRRFANMWHIGSTCLTSSGGVDYSAFHQNVSQIAGSLADTVTFLRLDGPAVSTPRVLALDSGDAIIGQFRRVTSDNMSRDLVVATFTKEEVVAARRRTAFTAALDRLTPRQAEVIRLVSDGLSNAKIAGQLEVCIKTVEKHRSMAVAKLGVKSIPELVRFVDATGTFR